MASEPPPQTDAMYDGRGSGSRKGLAGAFNLRQSYPKSRPTAALAALPLGQRALDLASRVALGHGVALVVGLLAAGHAILRLGPVVLEVDAQGHQRIARALGDPGQMGDLLAMQQQLAPPRGIVVEVAALAVRGDVRVPQPGFAAFDTRIGLAQGGMSRTQRLDLAAGQREARLVGILDEIVERGAAVHDDRAVVAPFFLILRLCLGLSHPAVTLPAPSEAVPAPRRGRP